uniref:CCHC-type domain-containing protein n=1 Tax=Ammopiptanthus mongolicus TaxID=126911 RepID=A0A4P8PMN6_AMMMO|nr:hypothetical protein [Ammopiptanthus mongolicus]
MAFNAEDETEESEDSDDEHTEDEDELSFISRKIKKMWKKEAWQVQEELSPKERNDQRRRKWSREDSTICYECRKPGHIRTECPQLKKAPKKLRKKKSMMATWEDLDESSSESEDEHTESAHICLMADTDSESDEVTPSNLSDLQNAFDELLSDSNILSSEYSLLKKSFLKLSKDFSKMKLEKESLEVENTKLKDENSQLRKLAHKEADSSQGFYEKPSEEVEKLQQKVSVLTNDLAKFVNGTKNLDMMLGAQKCSFDKAGLGYNKKVTQKYLKNFFVKASEKLETTCSFCHKSGHHISVCFKRRNKLKN